MGFLVFSTLKLRTNPTKPQAARVELRSLELMKNIRHPHLLAMFDAYSGMLAEVVASPLNTHDLSKVWSLHPLMAAGDVVAADRAFCSYAHLATLSVRGVYPVFRINQAMIVKFRSRPEPRQVLKPTKGQPRSRFIKRLGTDDQLVEWYKPEDKPPYMTREQYDALPKSLVVREVRYRVGDKGCRTEQITLVTTLLDPKPYSKRRLAALFKVRWAVEQDLKDLKTTLKMEVLRCKTPDGVRKELAAYARGLETDYAAVAAGLRLPWSNGQTEGQVNKLKLVKRQMYGRANFDLLRLRVLHVA